ncbi:5-oxoprolinase/urea amidolyase family protein [Comamonas sp. NoAH]|uniref:5-oxoprolinase subunit B/C family protein n=1 Tax=Comamonas halotolerans TaxID=3041496 RepID=UPI0024E165FA|nr:5-oxoprolinase/urea amidolyase family protein [Comamonas sp. NoAH]
MRFLPASDKALLLELDDLAQTMALYRHMSAQQLPGVSELVPAARTLLVHYEPHVISTASLVALLRTQAAESELQQGAQQSLGRLVEIPVHYNGEDLPDVAELLGITVAQVIERHTAQPYDAAFAGFAPGFVYLSGGANFHVPRRQSPRTKVPAGSVALGGNFSAVYPSASPGGWQLLGTTEVPMWDLQRAEPALVQPGFRVQFVDAARHAVQVLLPAKASTQEQSQTTTAASQSPASTSISFLSVGLQTLVQDEGRKGMAGLGISSSGALDVAAMHEANRVVGNPPDTSVLENVLGLLRMRSHGATTVAVTGAQATLSLHSANGAVWDVATHVPIALNDGDVLQLHAPTAGARSYIAVRGGWEVQPVLGSTSTDTLAQVGPQPLQSGQRIAVGAAVAATQLGAVVLDSQPRANLPRAGELVELDVVLGPRTDWFTPAALESFVTQEWLVTPQSNRVGVRLEGTKPLERARRDELPSEGTVAGAIQVPINGQPVLFLADHPLTGGYPVVAAVAGYHLGLAAQIPVGCRIRFNVMAPFVEQR